MDEIQDEEEELDKIYIESNYEPHDMCIYYPDKPCYPIKGECDCQKGYW